MRALIPLALAALLSACLPFGGRDGGAPRKDNPLAAEAIGVTSLDAPSGPAAPQAQAAPTAKPDAPPARPGAAAPPATPAAADATAAPTAETPTEGTPAEETPPPPPKSPLQIACEKDGGTWARAGGSVAMTCFRPTPDAGKSCRRESDCSTLCLARSRSCAPVTPLFGCHSILQDDGRAVTLCLD